MKWLPSVLALLPWRSHLCCLKWLCFPTVCQVYVVMQTFLPIVEHVHCLSLQKIPGRGSPTKDDFHFTSTNLHFPMDFIIDETVGINMVAFSFCWVIAIKW